MIIRICFPFYKTCPIYDKIKSQCKEYKGEHKFSLYKAQGTIVHDVRNSLVTGKPYLENPLVLPEFDFLVMIDSDIDCNLEDVICLAESGKDVVGLPYIIRGNDNLYNAGYLTEKGCLHIVKDSKGLIKVDGMGNGLKGWVRKVFETVSPFWFWPLQVELQDGKQISLVEDWAFDYKCKQQGFDIWCNLDKPVGHFIDKKSETLDMLNQVVENIKASTLFGGSFGGKPFE